MVFHWLIHWWGAMFVSIVFPNFWSYHQRYWVLNNCLNFCNIARDGPRQRAKGARAPPGSKIFFFLVYKIFIKKAWAPWFLAWAPLTSPIPIPASQPRSFQEPMKTLKNIYMCKKEKRKKKKKKKKT